MKEKNTRRASASRQTIRIAMDLNLKIDQSEDALGYYGLVTTSFLSQ